MVRPLGVTGRLGIGGMPPGRWPVDVPFGVYWTPSVDASMQLNQGSKLSPQEQVLSWYQPACAYPPPFRFTTSR